MHFGGGESEWLSEKRSRIAAVRRTQRPIDGLKFDGEFGVALLAAHDVHFGQVRRVLEQRERTFRLT